MTHSATITLAVAQRLHDRGVGRYLTGDAVAAEDDVLVFTNYTGEHPGDSLTVACYDVVTDDPTAEDDGAKVWLVQVRTRATVDRCDDLAEAAKDALFGHHMDLGCARLALHAHQFCPTGRLQRPRRAVRQLPCDGRTVTRDGRASPGGRACEHYTLTNDLPTRRHRA